MRSPAKGILFALLSAVATIFLFNAYANSQNVCTGQPNNACILVSNYSTAQVQIYSDDGLTQLSPAFLSGFNGNAAGEGIACTTNGNDGVMYTSSSGPEINAFDLDTGAWLPPTSYTGTGRIAGMAMNAAANQIYAGEYFASPSAGYILSFTPSASGLGTPILTSTPDTHDIALGTYPPVAAGDVFAAFFEPPGTDFGVDVYEPGVGGALNGGTQTLSFSPSGCANFGSVGTHCWSNLSGIAFDASGNLWANQAFANPDDPGTFEFVPTPPSGTNPPTYVPVNFTPDPGNEPIGITVAPLSDANYPGYILMANFIGGTVTMINPATCTGSASGSPGSCVSTVFFTPGGAPKYVVYNQSCPNIENDGYVEVCKQSNPSFPVSGTFDFTITAPQFNSGPVSVPVGECSGAIQVPSGTVTITEAQQTGVSVSDANAYSYNPGYTDELVAWPAQNPTNPYAAEVNIQPGNDVALETIATFTNASQGGKTGQLKICKIAGSGIDVGEAFSFSTSASGGIKSKYSIEAGPVPAGYCELAGTYPIGTQVTVKETVPKGVYATISVQPPGNQGKVTSSSVVATIGEGITEVDFTDSTQPSITATLTPKAANFGKQRRGTSGKPKVFTLTNNGNATMTITSIALGGANPTAFVIAGGGTCGSSLAGGASCTINVSFQPPAAGTFTAQLIVTDNASNSPQISTLGGTGI